LLRGGRTPLNASACTGDLKFATAWRALPAQWAGTAQRNLLSVKVQQSETRPRC